MSVRLNKIAAVIVTGVGAALLPRPVVSPDVVRLLVTFLGLLAAGVLPSITLVLNSMVATGKSVQRINELYAELRAAIHQLYAVFAWVLISFFSLLLLTALPEFTYVLVMLEREVDLHALASAVLVAAAAASFVGATLKGLAIPRILDRALVLRAEIAQASAIEEVQTRAPKEADVRKHFAKHPNHGRRTSVGDLPRAG